VNIILKAECLVCLLVNTDENPEETKQPRIEFSFPILIIRTQKFNGVFDRLGSLRISSLLSWIALGIVPVVAGIGLYIVCSSLFTLLWTPVARDMTREIGPAAYLPFPGINPILPILYGWIAIVCAIVIHEGAHGIIAKNRDLSVKSSGLLFFFIIPFGAFVDVDEDQITKAKPKDSLRVMAAGVAGNIVVALACILVVFIIVNGLTPVVEGVYIVDVTDGMPAKTAGLQPNDVFVSINNIPIDSYATLNSIFASKNAGDIVQVIVARGENGDRRYSTNVTLIESGTRAIIGISVGNFEERLAFYQTLSLEKVPLYMIPPSFAPGFVPFSDSLIPFYTHPLGSQWHIYANIFFWIWFVNVNVAVFNALPIYPLDGGRILDISLKRILSLRASEKTISRITYTVTITLICILVMIFLIPYIM
jgi:membrane-associated protease RseP (regulator of RpoE activity)